MEKLFEQLIDAAKKNRKGLNRLKNAAVTCQQYELAGKLREIELELYPESQDVKEAKDLVKELKVVFNMVGLSIADQTIYTIHQTLTAQEKMKCKFDLKTASTIIEKAKDIFDYEI